MSLMSQSRERAKARKAKEEEAKKKKGDEPTETFYGASNRLRRDLEKSGRRDLSGPTKEARETLEKRGRGVKPVSAAKVDTKPAAKANGKAKDTFKQAFAAARKEQGAGGKFTWNGKKYTTDRADDKPKETKGNGIVSKITKALTPKKADPARQKIAAEHPASGPGPRTSPTTKRGARPRSRMRKELRANTKSEEAAKAAVKAAPKQAAVEDKLAAKIAPTKKPRRSGGSGKGVIMKPKAEEEEKARYSPRRSGRRSGGSGKGVVLKKKGGSVKKSGYQGGGPVAPRLENKPIAKRPRSGPAKKPGSNPARPVNTPGTDPFKQSLVEQLKRPIGGPHSLPSPTGGSSIGLSKTGLKHGGKVRGVGAAKRGFGRGRIV